MRATEWILPPEPDQALEQALIGDLGVSRFLARLLCTRRLGSVEAAAGFLQPKLKSLGDPFLLPDMAQAVQRLLAAVDRGERIVLFGDYDVDGVTSLSILRNALAALGADVACFLPDRVDEGYGLSAGGVRRCVEEHRPRLLVAVDCGTASAKVIDGLVADGIDVIVVDHHECKEDLPRCTALVNPKRADSSGYEYLCSAGLAFKVAHALMKTRPVPGVDLKDQLDLVAVGTVSDLVPLLGENRVLVQAGLRRIGTSPRVGLDALMRQAGVRGPLGGSDISFRIGPRLNAAGRLGTALDALELLGCEDPAVAARLATGLDRQNRDRQELERKTLDEAVAQAEALQPPPAQRLSIVVGSEDWHPGVIGIVAARLARKFHRPACVIAFAPDGTGKGSGRSVGAVSLIAALGPCSGCLEQFGGHDQAAGMSLKRSEFETFRGAFETSVSALVAIEDLRARLVLDVDLELSDVDFEMLESHSRLEPFGMGNPQPMFFASGVTPVSAPKVLKERHLLLQLRQTGRPVSAIFFGGAESELPRPPWDVAYRVERNEYNGRVTAQVQVQQMRSCA